MEAGVGEKLLKAVAESILNKLIKSEPYTLILGEVLDKYKENEGFITDNDIEKIVDKNLSFIHPSEEIEKKLIVFEES